eukprot:COSAG06_NODE_20324_length_800_cov_0.514979_1_plen_117_part_00
MEGAIDIVMPASTGALAHGVACLALAALVAGTRRNLGVAHGGAEPSGSHALDAEERNVRALLRSYLTCYRTTHCLTVSPGQAERLESSRSTRLSLNRTNCRSPKVAGGVQATGWVR